MNIILYPNAKLNLGLRVTEKRPDGFHNLETVFVPFMGLQDILEITESDTFSFQAYGLPYDLPDNNQENEICVRAFRLLESDYKLPPVDIHLYKNIPIGAGMGGGSADGAFTLMGLNRLFQLNLSDEKLMEYAGRLGSDCPFFVLNQPMYGEGKGDELQPFCSDVLTQVLNADAYEIRLVTPGIHVSTPVAYRGITPRRAFGTPKPEGEMDLREILRLPIEQWKDLLENDFEKTVFANFPELARIKQELYEQGAVYAAMSGSGSTMFGIFRK